ncbi:Inosine/uridine-preferring nucleoside hydrolase domain-containing protein [Exophiala viscosa]|uniref:Inosine/uridine-preferring nucleoside hydrolase domain-containing protein n=1 Tax=Exophiala viscosa TaxID=2486360 RepID=A0AAN6DUS6_9EURO|nr:Inosine/uridine-preferring nucleoside hydrolase domain-containing protein [Exophiala viscosa]KAI1625580.1 Inosine/uridine-preferring nucleoside hydrolase domain-containing protein [Exophiala viscosa]
MGRKKIIIDTDPGIDDVLAILLALSMPAEVEVVLLSVTFGNTDVDKSLRNLLSLLHVLQKESEWRQRQDRKRNVELWGPNGRKPIVAVGAATSLAGQAHDCDCFHGIDGLGGIHEKVLDLTSLPNKLAKPGWEQMPEYSPPQEWCRLFSDDGTDADKDSKSALPFEASSVDAAAEMLRILQEHPPDTITIVALGPLTNCALAASRDPATFLRCKELVVMGGAVHVPGNTTPFAEANIYADAHAAALVFSLTSPDPSLTMPLSFGPASFTGPGKSVAHGQAKRRLNLTLFPLDITTTHLMHKEDYDQAMANDLEDGSPLARWLSMCVSALFDKVASQRRATGGQCGSSTNTAVQLHDPLCMWYAMTSDALEWKTAIDCGWEDIRVEVIGEWTKGQTVIDGRMMVKHSQQSLGLEAGESSRNKRSWLIEGQGNKVKRIVGSPGASTFGQYLLEAIVG